MVHRRDDVVRSQFYHLGNTLLGKRGGGFSKCLGKACGSIQTVSTATTPTSHHGGIPGAYGSPPSSSSSQRFSFDLHHSPPSSYHSPLPMRPGWRGSTSSSDRISLDLQRGTVKTHHAGQSSQLAQHSPQHSPGNSPPRLSFAHLAAHIDAQMQHIAPPPHSPPASPSSGGTSISGGKSRPSTSSSSAGKDSPSHAGRSGTSHR